MPRRLLKKVLPDRHTLSQRWFLKPFAAAFSHPAYWTPHRRGAARGFAIGLFVCFVPLPVHMLLSAVVAIVLRANIPIAIFTTLLVNPLTIVPTFFAAYWLGAHITGIPLAPFHFALSWEWMQGHFSQIWKPLLLGCLVMGLGCAVTGYGLASLLWRARVMYRYQKGPGRLRKRVSRDESLK